ncbi:MAG: hypothetical protein L0H93_02730 [Nocardioides sp.]|nr:hypothetical protein [Nocardioides sp.]
MSDDGAMSEQTSLVAAPSGDATWLDRMVDYDEVTRLGETFLLNAQVTDEPAARTRLIAPEALERTGEWLRGTLADPRPVEDDTPWSARGALSLGEAADLLGLDLGDLPAAYDQWRMGVEVYILIGDIVFLLANEQFIRHKRLTSRELGMFLSGRTAPFVEFDETLTGTALVLSIVPNRMAALGGLRGFRGSMVAAGEALQWFRTAAVPPLSWAWEREFHDDACMHVFGLDGLERVPVVVGYQREGEQP